MEIWRGYGYEEQKVQMNEMQMEEKRRERVQETMENKGLGKEVMENIMGYVDTIGRRENEKWLWDRKYMELLINKYKRKGKGGDEKKQGIKKQKRAEAGLDE